MKQKERKSKEKEKGKATMICISVQLSAYILFGHFRNIKGLQGTETP